MLQICQRDRVAYSVGAPACPQCGHDKFWLEGQEPPVEPAAGPELTATEKEVDKQVEKARADKTTSPKG